MSMWNNVSYLRHLTDVDFCPECKTPHNTIFKNGKIYLICLSCGWEQDVTIKFTRVNKKEGKS